MIWFFFSLTFTWLHIYPWFLFKREFIFLGGISPFPVQGGQVSIDPLVEPVDPLPENTPVPESQVKRYRYFPQNRDIVKLKWYLQFYL